MQKLNVILFGSCCYFLLVSPIKAQNTQRLLRIADSIFDEGNYTQALEYYEQLFIKNQHYTPKMLIKMAYIKKSLKDYTAALYYLNKYYFLESDGTMLKKIEELAKANRLSGYQYSEKEYFILLYRKYRLTILSVFFLCLLIFLTFILYKRRKSAPINFNLILFVILSVCFLWLTNHEIYISKAIIQFDKTHLMEDPSAASKLIHTLNKGHRVEILNKKDIWYHIKWEGKKAYIRQNNLLLVN